MVQFDSVDRYELWDLLRNDEKLNFTNDQLEAAPCRYDLIRSTPDPGLQGNATLDELEAVATFPHIVVIQSTWRL
jgi:hypothetical protein